MMKRKEEKSEKIPAALEGVEEDEKKRIGKRKRKARTQQVNEFRQEKMKAGVESSRFVLGLDISSNSPGACVWDRQNHRVALIGIFENQTQRLAFENEAKDQLQLSFKLDGVDHALDLNIIDTGKIVTAKEKDKTHTTQNIFAQKVKNVQDVFNRAKTWIHQWSSSSNQKDMVSVLIEGYAFGAEGQRKTLLAEVGGVARFLIMSERGWTFSEVPPPSLKSHFTGDGQATKHGMLARFMELVPSASHLFARLFNMETKTVPNPVQDIVDAFGLVFCSLFPPAIKKSKKKLITQKVSNPKKKQKIEADLCLPANENRTVMNTTTPPVPPKRGKKSVPCNKV
jgi:hypothetical protein